MKKILYVINDVSYFISHRLSLAQGALQKGLKVYVAGPQGSKENQLAQFGFLFISIPLRRSKMNPLTELKTLATLMRLYRNIKPDIIHHITIKPIAYGSLAACITRMKGIINTFTGLGYIFISKNLIILFIKNLILTFLKFSLKLVPHKIIFQNSDDLNFFLIKKIIKKENSVLIKGSGVNINLFFPRPFPDGPPIVLVASRMLWDKGIGEFVEAAKILKTTKKDVKVRFVLAGGTDYENPSFITKKQLQQWNTEGYVEWWGYQKNMPDLINQATIVCLPSYREGVPQVLIEGASCGRPLITTDAPGCREIVRHGVNGFLVPIKSSQTLAEAINKLLSDRKLINDMGSKSRQIVEKEFSQEIIDNQTLQVYNQFLIN